MRRFLAPSALLPDGWHERVRLTVDDRGTLVDVQPGWRGDGAVHHARAAGDEASGDPEASTDSAEPDRVLPGPVLPGIQNVHSHAFQRAIAGLTEWTDALDGGTRGLAERTDPSSSATDTFWSWRRRMYDFLARLGPEDVEAVAAQLYLELLEAGYTAVGEFHYVHHAPGGAPYDDPLELHRRVVTAAREVGIGLTHLPVLYMAGGFGGQPPDEGQARFLLAGPDEVVGLVDGTARVLDHDPDRRAGLALHSLRAVPPEAIAAAVSGVRDLFPDAPVHIHIAEQRAEVDACLAWSGQRPVAWLLDHAPVDRRWCLVHATHLAREEIRGVTEAGAVVGLCPTTEANLGDGLFPLADFLGAGGRFGVGSDSHVSRSPVEELRWLEYGQRLRREERNVASSVDATVARTAVAGARRASDDPAEGEGARSTGRLLFDAAVAGGEQALARGAGALEVGRRADWVVLDPDHPSLVEHSGDALLDGWIFSGNRPAVREVAVGGRTVVREGRHPGREPVLSRYREALRRLTR